MSSRGAVVEADVVVIGAGVAGLSTAYHLAVSSKKLKIIVLEQENRLGGHASGRNAGMIRQVVSDPFIAKLAFLGCRQLARASKKGWKRLSFTSNGSLLLAKKDKFFELEKIKRITRRLGVFSRWLSRQEARAKVPLLDGGDFQRALFCPSDALVEIKPLLQGFGDHLKSRGVPILFSAMPLKILKEGNIFRVILNKKEIRTKKIVNAAGAWCALLAENIGAQKIPLKPYQRHLYTTNRVNLGQGSWPFVWDLSHDFYFRPEGRRLLLSPCDKAAIDRKILGNRKEELDPSVKKILSRKLNNFSKNFKSISIQKGKSGLRTMTPDGRFVIGEDSQLSGFYWVAGLGGHGVTTCFSVGKLSSDIILGRRTESKLVKAFSPARFE